jgi:hypothetical protein
MIQWSPKTGLAAGIVLIFASNAVVLGGAMLNRSGTPDSEITLTERELALPSRFGWSGEDSGISLSLHWRVAGRGVPNQFSYVGGTPDWLDRKKLAELGFDVSADPNAPGATRRYTKMLPREVLLVLEYDGTAYREVLDQAKTKLSEEKALLSDNPGTSEFEKRVQNAKQALFHEETVNSRLIIIDAGTDHRALRSKYPDRSRYIIQSSEVRLTVDHQPGSHSQLHGYVQNTAIHQIHVPREHRAVLDRQPKKTFAMRSDPPRYSVTLKFGKRLEPWVTAISPLGE